MHIAFCLFKYFPFGGLQRDFMRFLDEALSRGHQCRIYCIHWQGDILEGIDLRIVPVKAWSNHRRNEKFIAWIEDDLSKHPVDILFGFNKMPNLDIYYAADSCYQSKATEQRHFLYRLGARYRHFSYAEKSIFQRGKKTDILLISETERANFIKHYNTEPKRLFMLPPGISKDRCRPVDADKIRTAFRNEFSLKSDDNLLLFIGSGFIKKGLDRAIRALAALPEKIRKNTQLFILGQDKETRFKQLAKELNIIDHIHFFSGRDDVPRFLLGADALIHPAIDEAAGIVLLEALVAGLPVIATDICGYAHHIKNANSGIIIDSPFNQKAMNTQLLEILITENRYRWQKNALDYAASEDLYNMHNIGIDLLEQCFQRLQSAKTL